MKNQYLSAIASILASILTLAYNYLLTMIARIPGVPDVRSVDFALGGLTKLEQRLSTAVAAATARGDQYSDLVDKYDEMAEAAYADADRAAKVQNRLATLLR